MNTLQISRAERIGGPVARAEGASTQHGRGSAYRTPRVYADFVVDGQALSTIVRKKADLISTLGWGPEPWQRSVVDRLLLAAPPDLPSHRHSLYVCPECGDLSCGAVSVVIERSGSAVVWRDFGYENDYERKPPDRLHIEALTEYTFTWSDYEAAIRSGLAIGGVA